MLPDRVSNPGPLTYESGALPIALRGPASRCFRGLKVHSLDNTPSEELPLLRTASMSQFEWKAETS